jgi:hypothetical protein
MTRVCSWVTCGLQWLLLQRVENGAQLRLAQLRAIVVTIRVGMQLLLLGYIKMHPATILFPVRKQAIGCL